MALGPGSIAFVGLNTDGNDNLAFVALEAIPSGTVIYFQDNEWNGLAIGSGGAFNTGESTWSWTATSEVAAGSIGAHAQLVGSGRRCRKRRGQCEHRAQLRRGGAEGRGQYPDQTRC
jgi:hypothetical protein